MPDIYLIEDTCRSYWRTANSKSYLTWLFKLALNIKSWKEYNEKVDKRLLILYDESYAEFKPF